MYPGTYTVTLTGIGPGGCADEVSTLTITVVDPSVAGFSSSPEYPVQLMLPNTTVDFKDESTNAVSWLWDFGDGTSSTEEHPGHQYKEAGEYMVTLRVVNELGCVSEVVHGPYVILPPDLFIPNVFTPNGDGIEDEWEVKYTGSQPYSVDVMDRWGVKVYESTNPYSHWDGTTNGSQAQEGVYFYIIKIGNKSYNGELQLLR